MRKPRSYLQNLTRRTYLQQFFLNYTWKNNKLYVAEVSVSKHTHVRKLESLSVFYIKNKTIYLQTSKDGKEFKRLYFNSSLLQYRIPKQFRNLTDKTTNKYEALFNFFSQFPGGYKRVNKFINKYKSLYSTNLQDSIISGLLKSILHGWSDDMLSFCMRYNCFNPIGKWAYENNRPDAGRMLMSHNLLNKEFPKQVIREIYSSKLISTLSNYLLNLNKMSSKHKTYVRILNDLVNTNLCQKKEIEQLKWFVRKLNFKSDKPLMQILGLIKKGLTLSNVLHAAAYSNSYYWKGLLHAKNKEIFLNNLMFGHLRNNGEEINNCLMDQLFNHYLLIDLRRAVIYFGKSIGSHSIHTQEQLKNLHDYYTKKKAEQEKKEFEERLDTPFPNLTASPIPELPGIIELMKKPRDMYEEHKIMHHCIDSYAFDPLTDKNLYFFRVLKPERATLQIQVESGQARVCQLYSYCNQYVGRQTRQFVNNLIQKVVLG